MAEYSFVGKGINRVDAREKVTGEAVFSADVKLPGMLFGKIKRSSHPFAKILSIDVSRAIKLSGVRTVITSRDVKQFRYGPILADELPWPMNMYALLEMRWLLWLPLMPTRQRQRWI